MSWLSFGRKESPQSRVELQQLDIPVFPLGAVLFPGGVLSLKVFEQRYLDMAAACMKDKSPFGVCLIASGQEVGAVAEPHLIGSLAHIAEADMPQLGILLLTVRGGRRFRIISRATQPDGLLRATVELIPEPMPQEVPVAQQSVLPLLQKIASDLGPEKMPEPHAFNDAAWVGYRLSEAVPVKALAKQKLLELDDPVSRLEILFAYLAQRKLA
ncbi:LON peptidase substrate-binding domain-containing protein [Propionivibrio sp.]|uniref:LON peptidase substrate-binding domain-containing protein n=1 Tax=Propionivibrio sp. TaxID=2212460 RepID=UPI00262873A5|nr:LON peptidase substrate-binding domain-containing protein [Propionivibrio sp.]